jgi:predicted membrane protein
MFENLTKTLSLVLYVLLGISVLFSVLFFAGFMSESSLIIWAYLLVVIATLAAVLFPVVYLAQNFNKAKTALLSLAGLLVVIGISYVLASGEVLHSYEKYGIDEAVSKNVGTGLITMYLLGFGSIGSILFFGVLRIFKK